MTIPNTLPPPSLMTASAAVLATALAVMPARPPVRAETPRWIVNLDASYVLPQQGSAIAIAGRAVPEAASRIGRSSTVRADVSWFVAPSVLPGLALNFSAGIPPRTTIRASGSIAGLGQLASVRGGALMLMAQYHLQTGSRVVPYVGAGVHRTIFMGARDGAVSNVSIDDASGAVLQAGAHVAIDDRWGLHLSVHQLFLSTTLRGWNAGRPVTAKATVDPTILGAGVSVRF